MPSIEELNRLISKCCEDMVDATGVIKDIGLEPIKGNIYKVGKAIAELSELRSEIYKIRPDLKPEMWDQAPSEEVYGEMFETAIEMTEEYLKNNLPKRAIETLESYIFIGPHEKYEELAQKKLEELRLKYGL